MTRILTTTATALLLTGGVAFAQSAEEQKGIGKETYSITDERGRGLPSDRFEDLDTDRDARMTREEFAEAGITGTVFDRVDIDGDGFIDLSEWQQATLGDVNTVGETFSEWDVNENDVLDEGEFTAGLYDAHDFDRSGDIDEDEFADYQGLAPEIDDFQGVAPQINDATRSGATHPAPN